MSSTREKYPLSERKIIKKTMSSVIRIVFGVVSLSVVFIPFSIGIFSSSTVLIGGIVDWLSRWAMVCHLFFGVFVVLMYLYQWWYFATYYYESEEDYLVIRKGPITPNEITIPWERIQDVYVDQDLLDRIFGLYDVHLSTATLASGVQAHIDGVGLVAANGLRELLLNKVKSRISRGKS
jgi:membrane protein YdbS with pleckstrin-like domain